MMKTRNLKILFAVGAITAIFSAASPTAFATAPTPVMPAPDGYLPSTGGAAPTGPLPTTDSTIFGPQVPAQQLPTTDYTPLKTPPQKNDPNYKLIVPIPGFNPQGVVNPLDYIKGIYNFGIGFGMLVAMAIIIYAGLKWTTSAGNVSAQSEAKDMILNAIYGVVMLLGAFLILFTISPELTKLTLPELKPVAATNFDFADAYFARERAEVKAVQATYAAITPAQAAEKEAADAATKDPTIENKIKYEEAKINRLDKELANAYAESAREQDSFAFNCINNKNENGVSSYQQEQDTQSASNGAYQAANGPCHQQHQKIYVDLAGKIASKTQEIENAKRTIESYQSESGKVPSKGGSR